MPIFYLCLFMLKLKKVISEMKKLLIITQKVDSEDQLLGFFIDWIIRLAQRFEKISILCLQEGKYALPSNVRVISLGKDRGLPKYIWLLNFYRHIIGLKNDYDAVLIHMNPIWVVLGGGLWKILRKKVYLWYTHKAITFKLRIAEKFVNKVFTASKESFRLSSKKVIVTGHGIDTELFKPDPNKIEDRSYKLKLLSVGRIAPVKNYGTLIEAAKILADRGVDFIITIVGEPALERDKDYEENLKLKVKILKLEDNFNFVGKVNYKDLPRYYQSHDLFIHLSKTGSLDKTLLEAMACGMRVLSSNDAAKSFLPEGWIFSSNDLEDLSLKILRPDKADFDARQYVLDNHDLKKLADKIAAII